MLDQHNSREEILKSIAVNYLHFKEWQTVGDILFTVSFFHVCTVLALKKILG